MSKYDDGYGYDLHFLELCAERANEIWRENEVKIFTNIVRSLDVYEDKYCEGFIDGWNAQAEIKPYESFSFYTTIFRW